MKKLSLLITFFIVGAWTGAAYAAELATITKIETNWENVQVPQSRQQCVIKDVPIYGTTQGRASTGDTVLGAVIGGALGNQVGGGSGKDAMTVLGAIVGADIANKRANQRQIIGYESQRQCSDVLFYEDQQRVRNYTIWYNWNGVQGRSYTFNQYSVGDRIPVSISINAN
jgi:uncharacterized protein YcfJ